LCCSIFPWNSFIMIVNDSYLTQDSSHIYPFISKFRRFFVTSFFHIFSSSIEDLIIFRMKLNRYLVNKRDVFFPEPWFITYLNRPRNEIPQRIERTNVYVVLPLFTLQELSMRVIKKCLAYDSQAFLLDIPRCLQIKLFTAKPKKTK